MDGARPDPGPGSAARPAFVLGGGGVLGATQVGMLRALLESGRSPSLVVGTSVGALNGAVIAGDPSLHGVDELADLWGSLSASGVFTGSLLSQASTLARHRTHLHSAEPLRRLLRWVLARLRSAAATLAGFSVELEEPPDLAGLGGGPLLVLARHAGPGDSFALVDLLLSRYRRRPRIVAKETLQWDPGLDVVLNRLSACFLPARGGDDRVELIAGLARGLRGSDAMLIFPEGGNWTPRRYRRALIRQSRSAGARAAADPAVSRNVLPPRPAGVLACLAARPDLDVVVVAHTGLDDLTSPVLVWRALPLAGRPMTVRWWPVPASGVPAAPDRQRQWLRLQWALVDAWIDTSRMAAGLPALAAGQAGAPLEGEEPDIGPVVGSSG